MKFQLREYQIAAINECRSLIRKGLNRVIIGLPTGSGKTKTAMGIIHSCLSKGGKVAFVCNRDQLIDQSYEEFLLNGFTDIGILQSDKTNNVNAKLLVCSIQTIARRGLPEDINVLIIDEAHSVAGTAAYWPIMNGRTVIGLTATPMQTGLGRTMSILSGPLFHKLVNVISMDELIKLGFLVDMVAYGPNEVADLSKVRVIAGEYREDELAEAMSKTHLVGDVVKQWIKYGNDKQTMVFTVNIAHSMKVCDEFVSMGVNAVHVDYKMEKEEKTKIYKDFKAGKIKVLCNCALLSEGTDFPAAEVLVLARPTKSVVRYIQMVGRVLRPSPGKTIATVLDHGGCIERFGFPMDIVTKELDDGKVNRSKSKKDDEAKSEPLPKECPSCKFIRRPGLKVCPQCGYTSKPKSNAEHSDEDLVSISRSGRKQSVTKTASLACMDERAIMGQLNGYAALHGYKPGWAKYKFNEIYGKWPGYSVVNARPEQPSADLLSWIRSKQIAFSRSKRG